MPTAPAYDQSKVPADWWKRAAAIETLNKRFRCHIVGLFMRGRSSLGSQAAIYTGFLLEYHDNLLWLTAGHVIDNFRAALTSKDFTPDQIVWMDTYVDQEGPHVPAPFNNRDARMKSWVTQGTDAGVILIGNLDREALYTNKNLRPFKIQGTWPGEDGSAEGYYIIGYPEKLVDHTKELRNDKQVHHRFAPHLVSLPMLRIKAPDADEAAGLWRFPGGFYGQIIPFSDRPLAKVEDITGMSGGPVISIAREADGNLRYRLVGIQSGWLALRRIIRAELIDKVLELIDTWL